jgi:hypothetical protein
MAQWHPGLFIWAAAYVTASRSLSFRRSVNTGTFAFVEQHRKNPAMT